MTFGSLFAGIGGLDLGLERAGMICKWQVEIDPFCQKVLAKHWPDVARYEDVRDVGGHNLEPVDLICGGFPCQDVSLAGKRAGLEGQRTTLWSEFARIIGEVRPRWVLAENVPGLLSSDNGRFFGNVLRDLAACGYDAEWDCIPAAAVGASHRRDRVYIVAYANSKRRGHTSKRYGTVAIFGRIPTRVTWPVFGESPVLRVADGVPDRVDRLRSLGNAVVPQVAEWIARGIAEVENMDMENQGGNSSKTLR